jgi:hypothetical protein
LAASGSRFQNVSEGRPEAAAVELWSSNCQIPWISDLPDRRSSLYGLACRATRPATGFEIVVIDPENLWRAEWGSLDG